jgi:hypothetical protein
MSPKHRRLSVGVGIVGAVVAIGAFGLPTLRRALLPLPTDRCHDSSFNPAAWRDSSLAYSAAAVRGCMVDDLLARQPMRGRSRAEIVALLGEPRPTAYFKNYDLVYWLGPERGLMSIDSEWLVMRLDSAGRVSQARIVTD